MKCPNCGREATMIFTDHLSGYPIDDDRSKICEHCATDEQTNKGYSLQELNSIRLNKIMSKKL